MSRSLEIILVSSSPIFAEPLRHWLGSGPDAFPCRLLPEPDTFHPSTGATTIVLIAPQDWYEMASWLLALRRDASGLPWLLLADLRLAGMFWPCIEAELCTILAPGAPTRQLRSAVSTLADGKVHFPPATVMAHFASHAPRLPDGTRPVLTAREFQCGCAISLGLTNQQITEVLHVGMSTLKGHVSHLMRKLDASEREEVFQYFERALGPSTDTSGMGD